MKRLLPLVLCLLGAQWANAVCTAAFTYNNTSNQAISFTDISTSTSGPIVSWNWNFDDGASSNQQNPVHTFPNAQDHYDVTLTITTSQGCTSSITIRVEICQLTVNASAGTCGPNFMVPLTITVNDIHDTAIEIEIAVDGVTIPGGPFDIDDDDPVTVTHLIEGDGEQHTITATSTETGGCTFSQTITVPNCGGGGPTCFLTNLNTVIQGGTTHNVQVGPGGNNSFSPQQVTITIGDVVHFVWVDNGHTTTSDATSGPDSWNSGEHSTGFTYDVNLVNPGLHRYYCQPHGGPNGAGMAGSIVANCPAGNNFTLTVTFNTSQANAAGYHLLVDGAVVGGVRQYSGTGPQSTTLAFPGDGQQHEIKIQDIADPTCFIMTNRQAPNCGAAPACNLTVSATQGGGCNAANQVPYNLTVVDINGGTSFTVAVDGVPAGSFPYNASGTTTVSINVPGNGQSHTITVTDGQTASCTGSTTVTTPNCATPCAITGLTATTGTPQTHTVLVQDFSFSPQHITIATGDVVHWQWTGAVQHTSTSDATTGANSWNSGLLGTGATYTSPVLSTGVHGYYCQPHGAAGGVGMAGTITVQPNCTNGQVPVTVTFTATAGGFSGYNVLVDGTPVSGGPFPYAASGATTRTINVPGDGGAHTIIVRDATTTTCQATTSITTPNCNAPTCTITVAATQNGGCNANNQVPVQVTVNATNHGANFSVKVDGQTVGTFPYAASGPTVVTVNVAGTGTPHTITVTDGTTPTCTASANVTTTLCNTPCAITGLTASSGGAAQTHNVSVQDFSFNPQHITIAAGDVVQWNWTGAVQHTSTSDATAGANSWDSGLLGTGATYTSPVLSAGVHAYYCAPHGAPGGVGMAGTITVQANCTNGQVPVTLTFTATAGSAAGFNVLVDGNPVPGGPFPYAASGPTTKTVNVPGDGNAHTIIVRDAANATCQATTSITTANCNPPVCSITVAATQNGNCNANNQVPVQVTVNATNHGANFSVKVDGQTVGTFPYAASGPTVVTVNVAGTGTPHTITVTDGTTPTCTASANVTTTLCNTPCAITGLTASSGGTAQTHNVSVQDFSFNPQHLTIAAGDVVQWNWTGAVQHTSTSDATAGANSWDSGLLGTGATYTSPVLSAGVHAYYCAPHGAPGGVGMAGTITVQANCTNGQVPVTLTFTATAGSAAGFNVLVDGNPVPGGPFPYAASGPTTKTVNVPGDGNAHTIIVRDAANATCQATTSITTANCNPPVCSITVAATQNGNCNANNQVPVQVTVNATNHGANFSVKVDGQTVGTFPYAASGPTVVTVNVAGTGTPHTITVTDGTTPTCTASANVTTTLCNTPCAITGLTASSGGASQTHNVSVQDFSFNPQHITIAAGDVVQWNWTGAVQHTSTSDATAGANSWDSGLLGTGATYTSPVLSAGVHAYYCAPHGAPGGVGMAGTITVQANCTNGQVPVTLTFTATAGSTAGFNVLVDGNLVPGGPFPYAASGPTTKTVNVPGDGNAHTIIVRDAANATCQATTSITTPNCNAPTCQLTATVAQNGGCNANGQVPVNVTVTAVGGGSNFSVKVDGTTAGTFNYAASGPTTVTVNVPGNGAAHSIQVIDGTSASCTATTTVTTTNCATPCAITGLTASAGASQTHVVQAQDFQFSPQHITIAAGDVVQWNFTGAVQHTATSDATTGPASWNSGLLGTGATFTSPVLPAGVHPYYCAPHGAPGGVGMAGSITVQPNCTNGQVAVALSFTATGGSFSGYNVLVDGNPVPGGPFAYAASGATTRSVNVPGDGQSHTIIVRDATNATCQATTTITTPNCNASTCQLTATATVNGACNANNQVPVSVVVTAIGAGSGFTVKVDGQTAGSFNYAASGATTVTVNVPGNGAAHTIQVIDAANTACSATTTVTTPNCAAPCALTNLVLSAGGGGTPTTHTVQVKDFEFSPKDLVVTIGDVVHFQWTGAVPHTTTSDATTGPQVWDSGLLGQGAAYDVTITEGGLHRYYCAPHGAPGGIGMSGTITANPPCNGGQVAVSVSFTSTNGSAAGYNVLLDGAPAGQNPRPYAASGANSFTLNVPGNGAAHTVSIQDAATSGCAVNGSVTTPNCGGTGGSCALTLAAALSTPCDSNNQVGVQLTVTHQNASVAGFRVKVDGNAYPGSPFAYGASGTTTVNLLVSGSNQNRTITVEDAVNADCKATATVLVPQCGPACVVDSIKAGVKPLKHIVEVRDFDFFPDSMTVVVGDTVQFVWTGVVPHTTTSDAVSGPNSWSSPLLGLGGTYSVVITAPGTFPYYCVPHGGPGGIGMSGEIVAKDTCAGGGKAWAAVGFYVTNGSTLGYRVFVDGQPVPGNPYQYQDRTGYNTVVVKVPGNGAQHLITVQDLDINYCARTAPFNVRNCPVICLIDSLQVTTGAGVVHTVEVRDFDFYPQNISVRTGEKIRFVWTGQIPHTATSDATSGPDTWDSGLLGFGATYDVTMQQPGNHPYYCIPHGGPGGIGMAGMITALDDCDNGTVGVAIRFRVSAGSAQGYRVFVDGQPVPGGPFAYDDPTGLNTRVIAIPGDGATHAVTVQDMVTNFCAATAQITVPDCNAACAITALNVAFPQPQSHTVEVKDFNFAPENLSIVLGDTVHFVWTGVIPHTTTSDAPSGPDSWDSGLLGQGATYDVFLQTTGDHPYYCVPHGGPNGIGMAGTITVNPASQGGMVTATVTFETAGTGNAGFQVYVDGTLVPGGPFPYAAGTAQSVSIALPADGLSHTVRIVDAANDQCFGETTVTTPDLGGAGCSLLATAAASGPCNTSNLIPYVLTVQSANTGDQFAVKLDGVAVPGSPFTYGTAGTTTVNLLLPGDGGDHTIALNDLDSAGCTATVTVQTTDCTPSCTFEAMITQSGPCNTNNQVPYNVMVMAVNGGAGFNVRVDGVLVPGSPFAYAGASTTVPVLLNGNGQPHTIALTAVGAAGCGDTLTLTTPNCTAGCALTGLETAIGVPASHMVEVRDFDFFPQDITVAAGDYVRFLWTGVVPHTATSDALNGIDSWNSGLLGQGATFMTVIDQAGVHPYYCVPHGAPGGIGMAGTITAVDVCDDGQLNVEFTFQSSNGGFGGYTATIDGAAVPGAPFSYTISNENTFAVQVPADGQAHTVVVRDVDDPSCELVATFTMPDCANPCFGFGAQFQPSVDHATNTVTFTNTSDTTANAFVWLFGDGSQSTEQHPQHTYAAAGTYQVCLVATDAGGCVDTICQTIAVGTYQCAPSFTIETDGMTVHCVNTSITTEAQTGTTWNFGNNQLITNQNDVTYTYPALGVYTLCLEIEAGACVADTCVTLDLSNPCLAFLPDFAYTVDAAALEVQFVDLTPSGSDQWLWGFGDGTTSNEQNPVHAYNQPGSYNVCMLVQNTQLGCNASHCEVVHVGVSGTETVTLRNRELMIFPNPSDRANTRWTMEGILERDWNRPLALTIYDVKGKTLYRGNIDGAEAVTLRVNRPFEAGIYMVELRSATTTYYGRILVQ